MFTEAASACVCSIPSLTLAGASSAATGDAATSRQAVKRGPRAEAALSLTPAAGCGMTFSQDLVRPKRVACRGCWCRLSFGG